MSVSLPMYDWPELADAHKLFWGAVRHELEQLGVDSPSTLTNVKKATPHWLSSEMLFSQTCGYPFATKLMNKVQLVATPHYDVEGCEGPNYSSAIVVKADCAINTLSATDQLSMAFNSKDSLSGFRCLKPLVGDPETAFVNLIESGAHRNSAKLVAAGAADCAAIDAICWHWFCKFEPKVAQQLRVVEWAPSFPALPFITSLATSPSDLSKMRLALRNVIEQKESPAKELGILGLSLLTPETYEPLAQL